MSQIPSLSATVQVSSSIISTHLKDDWGGIIQTAQDVAQKVFESKCGRSYVSNENGSLISREEDVDNLANTFEPVEDGEMPIKERVLELARLQGKRIIKTGPGSNEFCVKDTIKISYSEHGELKRITGLGNLMHEKERYGKTEVTVSWQWYQTAIFLLKDQDQKNGGREKGVSEEDLFISSENDQDNEKTEGVSGSYPEVSCITALDDFEE